MREGGRESYIQYKQHTYITNITNTTKFINEYYYLISLVLPNASNPKLFPRLRKPRIKEELTRATDG